MAMANGAVSEQEKAQARYSKSPPPRGAVTPQPSGPGVAATKSQINAGGIGGLFGATNDYNTYTANTVADNTTAGNKDRIKSLSDSVEQRQNATMQGAKLSPVDAVGPQSTADQDQTRAQQQALIGQLAQASSGMGPSVAQQQLKTATDRSMASNLAMAATAGTPGAQRAAAFQNAAATQDMAGQSANLRAQEIQSAQGLLASTAQGVRGQDLGLRAQDIGVAQGNQQAGLQASIAQAGLTQDANKTNLVSGVDQQNNRDQLVQKYLSMGMSLDQANEQAQIQQNQFNAQLLANQEAAKHGVNTQNTASSTQFLGGLLSSAGTLAAGGV